AGTGDGGLHQTAARLAVDLRTRQFLLRLGQVLLHLLGLLEQLLHVGLATTGDHDELLGRSVGPCCRCFGVLAVLPFGTSLRGRGRRRPCTLSSEIGRRPYTRSRPSSEGKRARAPGAATH